MAKLSHFWKWQIGRFWYFDVSKAPGEKILPFRVGPNWGVGSSLTESLMERVSNTPKQIWHPKISPSDQLKHLPTPKNKKRHNQIPTDSTRCLQTLSDTPKKCMTESNWSQSSILAKPWKAKFFSTDSFETSKYQNLPIYHLQKWLSFAIFLIFHVCQREITIYSLWITMY